MAKYNRYNSAGLPSKSSFSGISNTLGNMFNTVKNAFTPKPVLSPISKNPIAPKQAIASNSTLNTAQNKTQERMLPPQPPAGGGATYTSGYSSGGYSAPMSVYTPPSPQQAGIPSMEEAARRFSEMQAAKYGELVAPREKAISDYLQSRQPYSQVYEGKINELGIPGQQKMLSDLERQIAVASEDLEKYPKEDIERRQNTGMLSEAARRAVRVATSAPIQERLIGLGKTAQTAQIGYDRALSLARDYAQNYAADTEQGLRPLQTQLDSARSQFGSVADGIAQQLTGFSQDREAQLRQYEAAVNQGYQLSQIQAQQANQLKQQESKQIQTMGLVSSLTKDVANKMTLNSTMGKYLSQGLDPDMILTLYNAYSPYGPADQTVNKYARETPEDLQRLYGVSGSRYNTGSGSSSSILDDYMNRQ